MLEAVLWDVDGTLAETERDGHLVAMNAAFEQLGVPWRWSDARYGELLRVAGGFERLMHFMQTEPLAPGDLAERDVLARRIHALKNRLYGELIADGTVPLRSGVRELFRDCAEEGVRMAIVTTTSLANVAALLKVHLGAHWREQFDAVVCAEDAPAKKPDPLAYRIALERLGLAPGQAVAMEDSPAGLEAADALGIPVVIARSRFFADDAVAGALAVGPDLGSTRGWQPKAQPSDETDSRIGLAQLRHWHHTR